MKRGSQSIFLSALISIFCFALGAQGSEDNAACDGLVQTIRGCPCHGVQVKPTSTVRELCDDEKCRCLCSGGYSFAPTASVKKVSCDDCQMRGCPCHGLPSVQPTVTSRNVEQLRDSGTDETSDEGTGQILEQVCDINPALAIIANINARIGTITDDACCDTVLGVLGNTCTLLGPDATISGTLSSFTTTFTLLNEFIATLTTCCLQMQVDFNTTWTTLNSTIATVTAECQQLQHSFVSTWTELNDVNNSITSCCASVVPEFAQTWTQLAELLQTITTCQAAILAESEEGCDVLIYQSDIPYTITAPGVYCLVDSVNVTGGVAITVSPSVLLQGVIIDLHNNTISGDITSTCIYIPSSEDIPQYLSGVVEFKVFNGTLSGANGIVAEYVTMGTIKNVNIVTSAAFGIFLESPALFDVENCTIDGQNSSQTIGIQINGSAATLISDCTITGAGSSGVVLNNCTNTVIKNSQVTFNGTDLEITYCQDIVISGVSLGNNTVQGMLVQSSTSCFFYDVTVQDAPLGFNIQNSINEEFANVTVSNISGLGISCQNTNFLLLRDTTLQQCAGGAVLYQNSNNGIFRDLVMQQSNPTGGSGFDFISSSTNIIDNVSLQETALSISNGYDFIIHSVKVQDNAATIGIFASGTKNILIKNCSSISNGAGIFIDDCVSVQLIGNECINNIANGINLLSVTYGQVRSNRVLANDTGINVSASPHVVYYNNLSTENTTADYVNVSNTISPSSMSFGRSTGYWINVTT